MTLSAPAISVYSPRASHRGPSAYGSRLNGFEISRDGSLRFGIHHIQLDHVRGYAPVHHQERDIDSVLATVAVFMGAAALLLVLVFELGWRERFLVGGLLFASIAFGAIIDLTRTMKLDIYRLDIDLEGGSTVTFVTPDRDILFRMMTALEQWTGLAPKLAVTR